MERAAEMKEIIVVVGGNKEVSVERRLPQFRWAEQIDAVVNVVAILFNIVIELPGNS